MDEYLDFFNQHQLEIDPIFNPEMSRKARMDSTVQLDEAKRKIKLMQYTVSHTVAAEKDRFVQIKLPDIKEGPKRGPTRQIDIIEGCPVVCRVEVQGRKGPLRIHLDSES